MSLFPIDLDRYRDATIEWLYYLLFPYIKEDFMGRKDCENVHRKGNMSVVIGNTTVQVEHILQGGSSLMLDIKEIEYQTKAEEGQMTIQSAQESGDFNA